MYKIRLLIFTITLSQLLFASPYTELVPKFNRLRSNVMVRKLDLPTLANLDFAAYDKNPVLFDRETKIKITNKPENVILDSITFGNAILASKDDLNQTPLTPEEIASPLAWKPFLKKLWGIVKDEKFQVLSSKIASYKWNDPDVFLPYQEVSTVYLHNKNGTTEFWVKIEFSPWVDFLKNVNDEDNDGFLEIYAKLNPDSLNLQNTLEIAKWVNEEYCKKVLTHDEIIDWITDIASYWYPTKNTDILDISDDGFWPGKETKKSIKKELKGLKFENPLAVVEGKPHSPKNPIYNVFIVNEIQTAQKEAVNDKNYDTSLQATLDTSVSDNFKENQIRFTQELTTHGSYENWIGSNSAVYDKFRKVLSSQPASQMGIEGKDGWLFFLKSVEYIVGGDLSNQQLQKNPFPHLIRFKSYLDSHNINFIFVAVPNKEEVYFNKLLPDTILPASQYVNPYGRKFLSELQNAGIEVIDLLPHFLKARAEDSLYQEGVYQKHDTHWSYRGLEIASNLIASRIRQYSWYSEIPQKIDFKIVDTSFTRLGDIVDRLPEEKKINYQPVLLSAKQVVTPEGTLMKSLNSSAPIMLIGDSFTGVYESVDCKSAGVGAHIAAKTGLPIDIITSWGGGPLVRQKAMKARKDALGSKKVVIYMMVARDLYNYSQNWDSFPED